MFLCEADCESPWRQPGENSLCYAVSESSVNYYNADKFCKDLGGYLAEPRTEKETEYLELIFSPEKNYWIGLTDLADEGEFLWWSDYSIPEYTNWDDRQPDNYDGKEDCVESSGYRGFKWNDLQCIGHSLHAACQKSP